MTMTLPELTKLYGTDEDCREILTRLRWPEGVTCPRCKNRNVWYVESRKQFTLQRMRYQFSVTTGTIFNDSHLPLTTWFMAVLLLVEAKQRNERPAIETDALGLAQRFLQDRMVSLPPNQGRDARSRKAHARRQCRNGRNLCRRQGTGTGCKLAGDNKETVIGIRQRNGDLRFFHAKDAKAGTIAQFIRENISEDVDVIITDDFMSYPFAMKRLGFRETSIRPSITAARSM